jgi:predicted protein tyrosine phosphatase
MRRVLFICSANRLRSPTAEQVFSTYPDLEVASAGLSHDAAERLTPEHLEGVDTIFVMEKAHKAKLSRHFRTHLKGARIICLDIPDDYAFMQPELIALLEARVTPHLRRR